MSPEANEVRISKENAKVIFIPEVRVSKADTKVIFITEVCVSTANEVRILTVPDSHDRGSYTHDLCGIKERFMGSVTPQNLL